MDGDKVEEDTTKFKEMLFSVINMVILTLALTPDLPASRRTKQTNASPLLLQNLFGFCLVQLACLPTSYLPL